MKKRYEIDLKHKIKVLDRPNYTIRIGYLYDRVNYEARTYLNTMNLIEKGCLDKKATIKLVIEYEEEILDKIEKKYLENVIRPFKNRDDIIVVRNQNNNKYNFLSISIGEDELIFPDFPKDTMYKGMEINRAYTIEELGLFQ